MKDLLEVDSAAFVNFSDSKFSLFVSLTRQVLRHTSLKRRLADHVVEWSLAYFKLSNEEPSRRSVFTVNLNIEGVTGFFAVCLSQSMWLFRTIMITGIESVLLWPILQHQLFNRQHAVAYESC